MKNWALFTFITLAIQLAWANPMSFQLSRSFEGGRVYAKFDLQGQQLQPYGADRNYCQIQIESPGFTLNNENRFQQVQQKYQFAKGSFFAKSLQVFRYVGADSQNNLIQITCQSENTTDYVFDLSILNKILIQIGQFN